MNRYVMIAVIVVLTAGGWAVEQYSHNLVPEVRSIVVSGTQSAEMRGRVEELLIQNIDSASLGELQMLLVAESWIKTAGVRKAWPDRLIVEVQAEEPVARWNADSLINREGRVFRSDFADEVDLPHLYGEPGSEQYVMTNYLNLARLMQRHDLVVRELHVDARGAIRVLTSRGTWVSLGNDEVMARVSRFLVVARELKDVDLASVDARYASGVAVRYKEEFAAGAAIQPKKESRKL